MSTYMGVCTVCRTSIPDPEDYTATMRRTSNLVAARDLREIQEKAKSLNARQAMVYCPVCRRVRPFSIGRSGCCG